MTVYSDATVTVNGDDDGRVVADEIESPRLIVALDCRRPLAPALRLTLTEVDQVTIGRGPERALELTGARATLALADHEASRRHVVLRRRPDGWELADLGSKNGTVVNGVPTELTALADGDVIEVGGTMLMFRETSAGESTPRACELSGADAAAGAFMTLDPELARRFADLDKVAGSTVSVLLCGETGTGKELAARAVHDRSGLRGPFVPINCGALPRGLVESELFGYRRGAFSGAREDRDGLVRRADGGTLFLDEIGELPLESQVALLRVLQEHEIRPIGGGDLVSVDVRVVAATHQDLRARISDGRFRQDLFARISGYEMTLPPLRHRREDIGVLIGVLLRRSCEAPDRVTIQRGAARALLRHHYPLNVRELEQALRTATVLASGREIKLAHLPDAIRDHGATSAPERPGDRVLRYQLVDALTEAGGNVTAAGRSLGKAPMQIRRWCRRFGIDVAAFRAKSS